MGSYKPTPSRRTAATAAIAVALTFAWTSCPCLAQAAPSAQEEALSAFKLGVSLYRKGDFDKSAALFHTAFSLEPKAVYLFNAARSEHRGGKLAAAEKSYERCAQVMDGDPKVLARATSLLQDVRAEQRRLAEAAQRARAERDAEAVRTTSATPAQDTGWRGPVAWGATGVGAVLLGAGGWWLISASSAQADLDKKTQDRNENGKVVGIDAQSYTGEKDDIDARTTMGITAAAAGVAVTGVGIWLLVTSPDAPQVALTPTRRGPWLAVTLRF